MERPSDRRGPRALGHDARLRTEEWWAALDQMHDAPSRVSFAPLLREYRDVFRLASPPQWVAQPLCAALSIGRRPAVSRQA